MGDIWQLNIRTLTGDTYRFDISRNATVFQLKERICRHQSDALPFLQRLVFDRSNVLEDNRTLSSYSLHSGAVINLILTLPHKIYVQDPSGRTHEMIIPTRDPNSYTICDLKKLVQTQTGQRLNGYSFHFQDAPIEEVSHGKQRTLGDCGIGKEETLFLLKTETTLIITEPKVDVCFLMDCTGSMRSWIEAVKNNVKDVRDRLGAQYKGCDLRFAFVRYTDYDQPEYNRTTWIDFTKSIDEFCTFINPIVAGGGRDEPEDIMGALKITLTQLTWSSSGAKVLIHIADAPCHGIQYHNTSDNYPNGDPAGITHDQMMREVVRHGIQYWFGYIRKDSTDKMINIFNQSLQELSDRRLLLRQIDATQPDQLASAVHKSVTASVTAAATISSCAISSTHIPNWSTLPEQRMIKTPPPGPKSMHHLQEGLILEQPSVPINVKVATEPFQDGEEYLVFRGYQACYQRNVVLKKHKGEQSLSNYMKALEVQTIASTYAREFNNDKKNPSKRNIEFTMLDVVDARNGSYYLLQPFIDGTFEKYNTNNGVVCTQSSQSDLMQAFSHFTWVQSGQSLLICDLQGVNNSGGIQLVDPAIHCRSRPKKYGDTDQGYLGIRRFFNSHTCNGTCRSLGLEGYKL